MIMPANGEINYGAFTLTNLSFLLSFSQLLLQGESIMRREVFEATLKSMIPRSALLNESNLKTNGRPMISEIPRNPYQTALESGTTVLAFHFNEGLILAGDRQTSSGGFKIISKESVKVCQIGSHSGFMFAGMVSDGQEAVKYLQRVEEDFLNKFERPLSLNGQANCLSRFLRLHYNHGILLEAWGIIAGFNINPLGPKIYYVEPTGSKLSSDFETTGSGSDEARSELKKERGKIKSRALSLEQAIELAVRAIYMAGDEDMSTSDVRLAVPTVAAISLSQGFKFINSAKVEEVRDKLIDQERKKGNVS